MTTSRTTATVSRRTALAGLGAGSLGLALAATTRHAAAQEGTPANGGPDLAGSWRVVVTASTGRTFVTLSTFGTDGTAVTSTQPAQPAPPGSPPGVVFFSAAHGAWEATGPTTANFTFVHLRASSEGQPLGTTTPRVSITLGADGDTFSGEFVTTLADPAGNVVATLTGTVQATRIVAEAPVMPAATPAA
jgi:hypothetical protein